MVYKGNLEGGSHLKRTFEPEEIGNPAPGWYWSYTSMALLVLAFFVVLVSMTAMKKGEQLNEVKRKFEEVKEAIKEEKKVEGKPKIEEEITTRIDYAKGLIVSLKEKILFETGKADLSLEAKGVLDKLHPIFLKIPNQIVVEGHTDNVPIRTVQFPSNWELSTARATQVIRYLIEEKNFPKERIAATGYGEYHPVAGNDTLEGRAENRRVDFVIAPLAERQKTAPDKLLLIGTKELE